MKKMIITCALVASASVMSYAQHAASASAPASANAANNQVMAQHMAEKNTKMYEKQLGLNAEQYKKVYDVQLNMSNQMMALRSAGAQPGEGQVMQMHMYQDQQMKTILTADQYKKYESTRPVAPTRPAGAPQPAVH